MMRLNRSKIDYEIVLIQCILILAAQSKKKTKSHVENITPLTKSFVLYHCCLIFIRMLSSLIHLFWFHGYIHSKQPVGHADNFIDW